MDKYQRFVHHHLGRQMVVLMTNGSANSVKTLKIEEKDKVIFENDSIINASKGWGVKTNLILDVLVTMLGVFKVENVVLS